MRLRGGYDIPLAGRPSSDVRALPLPKQLFLPTGSRRFEFCDILVTEGQRVSAGDALATDPASWSVPLLAPAAGIVRLDELEGHIVIEVEEPGAAVTELGGHADDAPPATASGDAVPPAVDTRRDDAAAQLVRLGAWQFIVDAYTGLVPAPDVEPSATIVSTLSLEPFVARGDVHLQGRVPEFVRGLDHLRNSLGYKPVHVVLPDTDDSLTREIREALRGRSWVRIISVRPRYPHDHVALLARHIGLRRDEKHPVLGTDAAGVLAIDGVLTHGRPALERLVTLGGPAVDEPHHVRTVTGYPLEKLLEGHICGDDVRVLSGGALTGVPVDDAMRGMDCECTGITVLGETSRRTFLAFARPGWSRNSYGRTFVSSACPAPLERLKTELRGELRPCVACGNCAALCPAGILPGVIHKYLYANDIDEAHRSRVDLCVECGLCSYVCPSKIELREQFVEAKQVIREEAAEAKAAAVAEAERIAREKLEAKEAERAAGEESEDAASAEPRNAEETE